MKKISQAGLAGILAGGLLLVVLVALLVSGEPEGKIKQDTGPRCLVTQCP